MLQQSGPTLLQQCVELFLPGVLNRACCHTALQPHDPEASDEKVTIGAHLGLCTSIMLCVFRDGRKASHQARSALNSASSFTQWSGCLALVDRSINCRQNTLPACTTYHACQSFPTNESSSHFLHAFLAFHLLSSISVSPTSSLAVGSSSFLCLA